MAHKGYNNNISPLGNSAAKKYMFGGKESQDELGLSWYDVTARNYDPALGRWMNLDPLAEQMFSYSPYSYAFNSPVYFFDEDGNIPLPLIINYSRISSQFGLRMHPIHKVYKGHGGVDLVTPDGSSVNAAARGVVEKVGWDPDGYGRYIVIRHADGYYSLYAHLEKSGTMVVKGDNISNGQMIATSGNTGGSTGSHLHFEIVKANSLSGVFNKNNKVDPQSIYDLDQKLHGREMPSLTSGSSIEWSLYWGDFAIKAFSSSSEVSDNSSESRPKATPAKTIDPIGPVIIPSPGLIPGQLPTPTPTPAPPPIIIPPRPPDSGL